MIEQVERDAAKLTPKRGFGMGVAGKKSFPAGTQSVRSLLGARVRLAGFADYTAFVDKIRDQEQTSACVGFTEARIIHVRAQLQLFGGKAYPGRVPYPAEMGCYALAREEESPDGTSPLPDDGCDPADADAAVTSDVGVPLERDFPFDPTKISERVPPDVLAKALAFRVQATYLIDSDGAQRVDDACHALDQYGPFGMAIQVGDNYEAGQTDASKPVAAEGKSSPIYGGHDVAIVGYRVVGGRRQFKNAGSWGTTWSLKGYAWLDEAWVSDPRTTNLRVKQVVPNFSVSAEQRAALAGRGK